VGGGEEEEKEGDFGVTLFSRLSLTVVIFYS